LNLFFSMKKEIKEKPCQRCFSNNLRLEKWSFGKKSRMRFLVKVICLGCSLRRGVKVDSELFRLTRKLRWRSKYKKPLEKEIYDYLVLRNGIRI